MAAIYPGAAARHSPAAPRLSAPLVFALHAGSLPPGGRIRRSQSVALHVPPHSSMIARMAHDQSPGGRLRQAIENATIAVPGAPFALAGRLIESAGFNAAYVSGAAFSAGSLAVVDEGLFTLTELAEHVRRLTSAVTIPVIVDADTGFGETANVERTIGELELAGAAAIQLEDQQLPKKCGHLTGKTLVAPAEMAAKIRAAAAARRDPATVIIARTDASGVTDFDDALARAAAYLDAGADWIFPEALTSKDEFARFADAIEAPLVANMTEFGKSPLLDADELADLGYAVVLYPVTLLRIALKAMDAALSILAADGHQGDLLDLMVTREELYELLEYDDFKRRQEKYR
jgi:methylisocitrate lyase